MTKIANQQQLDRMLAFAQAMGFPLEVSIEPWRPQRTDPQNRYLWKAVYEPLVDRCGFSKEEWHEYFCELHFGSVEHVKPSGEVYTKPLRTTTRNEHGKRDVLKGRPFMDFVTFVESECARRGVFVVEEYEEKAA